MCVCGVLFSKCVEKRCLLMEIIGCMDERTIRDHKWLWEPLENNDYAKLACKEKLNVPVTLNSGLA